MNPKTLFSKLFSSKTPSTSSYTKSHDLFSTGSVLARDINADYENMYPSARKAEQAFAMIRPFATGMDGKKIIPSPQAMQKIYRPNQEMSGYRFRVALAGSYLMHNETFIRVHYDGEQPSADNITGYTFLEHVTPYIAGGKKHFHTVYGNFTSDEVLTIPSGVNPFHVTGGYSAARAARRWTTLDDYIVDYQSSFFRNGAIPAGHFKITAPTINEYEAIKTSMKKAHQGADNANNVIYSHVPTDENGTPNAPTIEWISYDQKNKDLAVKDLVDATRERVEGITGVPKQIQGLIEDTHYNGVRLAEYVITEYVARPMAMEIWDTFTHELNRVTGGTGFAIDFDLETPVVQDEEKVRSERKSIDLKTIREAQEAGYTLESVVQAFGYPEDYLLLEMSAEEEQDDEVVEDDESLPTQDPDLARGKAVKDLTRESVPEDEDSKWQREVEVVAQAQLEKHIDKVIDDMPSILERSTATKRVVLKQVETTEEEDREYARLLMLVLFPVLAIRGGREYERGVEMIFAAGLDASGTAGWTTTEAIQTRYAEHLNRVGNSYNAETSERIRRILAQGRAEGLTANEMRSRLRDMKELDGYRATRLGRTEVHRTQGRSSVEAMRQLESQTGYTWNKIWRTASSDPCEFCVALDGTIKDTASDFIPLGETVEGVHGGVRVNDFENIESAEAHPNCGCRIEWRLAS